LLASILPLTNLDAVLTLVIISLIHYSGLIPDISRYLSIQLLLYYLTASVCKISVIGV